MEPVGLQNGSKIEPRGHLGPQASPSDPPSRPRTLPRLVLDSILHDFFNYLHRFVDPILTSFPTDVVKISLNCAVAQKKFTLISEACRDMSGKTFRFHPQHQLMRGGRCAQCAFWTGRKMWWELRPSSYWENIGGSFVLEVAGKHGGRFVP